MFIAPLRTAPAACMALAIDSAAKAPITNPSRIQASARIPNSFQSIEAGKDAVTSAPSQSRSDDVPDSPSLRFLGIDRLYGAGAVARLSRCRVAVVGLGGVGSWAVEALARSGIGALRIIDADEVCVSNVNRQLPALDGEFGRAKAELLAERV